jgi:PAS domain S-box-containing protein
MQYLLFIILSPITATITIVLLFYIRQATETPVTRTLFWFMVTVTGFLIFNTLELVAQSEAVTLWFAKANYVFIAIVPVMWFAFALQYTGNTVWLAPNRFWLFLLSPLLTNIFVQTNELHGLIWSEVRFLTVDYGLVAINVSYGPWFWIHGAYSYLMVFGATILLGRDYFRAYQLYRKQSYWIVIGALTPALVNLFYIFRIIPGWAKDFTSVGFGFGGIALAIGIYRFHLFDVMPVARSTLIEIMRDGMLVLDQRHRILDLNSAARTIVEKPPDACIGQPVTDILPVLSPLLEQSRQGAALVQSLEISQKVGDHWRYFDVRFSSLAAALGTREGFLVLLHDITEQKAAQDALKQLNEQLEQRVELRTQDLRMRAAELEAMALISSELRKAVTLESMLEILIRETVRAVEADSGVILLANGGGLVISATAHLESVKTGERIAGGDNRLWEIYESGEAYLVAVQDLDTVPGAKPYLNLISGFVELAIQPVRSAERSLGLLVLFFKSRQALHDEKQRLLRAITEMGGNAIQRAQVLDSLEQLVQHRTKDLSTLYEITAITNEFINIDHLLAVALEIALKSLGTDCGILHLLQDDETLSPVIQRGFPEEILDQATGMPAGRALWDKVLAEKQIIIAADLFDPAPALSQGDHDERQVFLGVPVHAKGRLLGTLCILSPSLQKYSAEDITLLVAIADHIGGAVEAARLRIQAEQAAVFEERQRLARELHDSVMQTLYSLILFAEAGGDALRSGTLDLTEQYINQLSEAARQALKEMRLLVFELRPDTLQQEGLAGALRKRIEVVEQRAGMKAKVQMELPVALSEREEDGLYRIAQEALNNVLKHAGASQVDVALTASDHTIQLTIQDDGKGFEMSEDQTTFGVGLASMSERANELGGWLEIQSAPGQGTRVHIQITRQQSTGHTRSRNGSSRAETKGLSYG